jgi:hypothetical protein
VHVSWQGLPTITSRVMLCSASYVHQLLRGQLPAVCDRLKAPCTPAGDSSVGHTDVGAT